MKGFFIMISMRQVLIYLSLKYKGDWRGIRDAIANKERVIDGEALPLLASLKENTITLLDDDYPLNLKQAFRPPFVLYYRGNKKLLSERHKLGIIGSRENSEYAAKAIETIVGSVAEKEPDVVLISGMAKGCDFLAEQSALKHKLRTVSVLGNGLDICYPSSSKEVYEADKENNLLISEYPCGVEPASEHFPERNRLIASLIDSLLIGEGEERSGTAITVRFALDEGKDILCLPTGIFSHKNLCNLLIRDGAYLCMNGEDVLQSLHKV